MGPLGVIPRSFRVDGYFEWVVILSVTVRGNAFIAQQNRLSATARVFVTSPLAEILKPIALRFSLDFIPNHFPNLKIFHFVTKMPLGFVLSATVRGNAFAAKQNRLSATARVFRTFAEVLGAKGLFKLHCSQHRRLHAFSSPARSQKS